MQMRNMFLNLKTIPVYAGGLNSFGQCGYNAPPMASDLECENSSLGQIRGLSERINQVRMRERNHFILNSFIRVGLFFFRLCVGLTTPSC